MTNQIVAFRNSANAPKKTADEGGRGVERECYGRLSNDGHVVTTVLYSSCGMFYRLPEQGGRPHQARKEPCVVPRGLVAVSPAAAAPSSCCWRTKSNQITHFKPIKGNKGKATDRLCFRWMFQAVMELPDNGHGSMFC